MVHFMLTPGCQTSIWINAHSYFLSFLSSFRRHHGPNYTSSPYRPASTVIQLLTFAFRLQVSSIDPDSSVFSWTNWGKNWKNSGRLNDKTFKCPLSFCQCLSWTICENIGQSRSTGNHTKPKQRSTLFGLERRWCQGSPSMKQQLPLLYTGLDAPPSSNNMLCSICAGPAPVTKCLDKV